MTSEFKKWFNEFLISIDDKKARRLAMEHESKFSLGYQAGFMMALRYAQEELNEYADWWAQQNQDDEWIREQEAIKD